MIATVAVGEYVAALIIVVMLSEGEALEEYAAARARASLTTLLERAPSMAHRIVSGRSDAEPGGDALVVDVLIDEVEPGDVLLVRPSEVVPVNGLLLEDEAAFDESSLTGESLPVLRTQGEQVLSGALNGTRAVRLQATSKAVDSQYQQILRLVAEAEDSKAPTVRVADRAYLSDLAPGETSVAVAVDGRFVGNLVLNDPLRANAAATVGVLREQGIEDIAMLTGDNRTTAYSLAQGAGITDVHVKMLPQDKVDLVTSMPHRPVIMVGDGVNDAPVLAVAEVGIAMGARCSTAASEAADVVITRDDIGKVVQAIDIGKRTFRVALSAIWIGVALSLGLMMVDAFGHIPAVAGALTQELVDLVAILYALLALRPGTGHPAVLERARPERDVVPA